MNTNNEKWIIENSRYLRLRVIEHSIGCPVNTLQKWLNGERKLSERWGIALDRFVDSLRGGFAEQPLEYIEPSEVVARFENELTFEEKDKILSFKPQVQINTSIISEDQKTVINTIPDIEYERRKLKNMIRIEPNIYSNGEIFEVSLYKDGKQNYIYTDNIDRARECLELLRNK